MNCKHEKVCQYNKGEYVILDSYCATCSFFIPDRDDWRDVREELEYYKRATDFLDSLIAGFGGAIDDERLQWYKDNPLPSPPDGK